MAQQVVLPFPRRQTLGLGLGTPRRGLGQIVRPRGLGQVLDENQVDYTNLGWDAATAANVAALDNQYNSGQLTPTQYSAQVGAALASIQPTGTVSENVTDYTGLGWPTAAATAAANAGTGYNTGTLTLAQYQAAMTAAGQQIANPTATTNGIAATTTPVTPNTPAATSTGTTLTGAQQAAVDNTAITQGAGVINTAIQGAVAATKGTTLANTSAANTAAATNAASTPTTGLTTGQKWGIGIAAGVVIVGVGWWAFSGPAPRRRRRR